MDSSDASARAAILKAANFAAVKHKDQRSNEDETIPFINHPLGTADTLANIGKVQNPEVLQAALLHDTVEWADATFEELEAEFGRGVADLVREVTPAERGGNFQKPPEKTILSTSAKEIMLADHLWYLTTLDQKAKNLTDAEMARFRNAALEIENYRGANEAIEKMLDRLFKQRNVVSPSAPKGRTFLGYKFL